MVTALAASMLTFVLFAIVVVVLIVLIGRSQTTLPSHPEEEDVPSLRELASDEPSGPAGAGAPGEERPPPIRTGERSPPKPAGVAGPAPAKAPAPEGPVRVRVVRTGDPPEGEGREAVSDPAEASAVIVHEAGALPLPPPPVAMGTLFVSAKQPAEVYIGGQYVAPAPVTRELPPGRYAISLVATDGRRRTFELDLSSGVRVERTWDFDRMEWR
jgi:hypothetical protein